MTPDQEIRVVALRSALACSDEDVSTDSVLNLARRFEEYIRGPVVPEDSPMRCPHVYYNHHADGCAFCDCTDPYGRRCG